MKMLPLAVYIALAIACQALAVVIALAVDYAGFKWGSVVAFGTLYLVMYGVAWKLTVWIVDGFLVKKGYVQAAPSEPAQVLKPEFAGATAGSSGQAAGPNDKKQGQVAA